jgi:hypothetical protein
MSSGAIGLAPILATGLSARAFKHHFQVNCGLSLLSSQPEMHLGDVTID